MTLKEIANLMRESAAPKWALAQKDVYTFARDRENRSVRFVRICLAYKRGDKVEALAEEYQCSETTIKRYARMAGLPKRPKFLPCAIRWEVENQLRLGLPIQTIADNNQVSPAYVSKLGAELGLRRYKPRLTRR